MKLEGKIKEMGQYSDGNTWMLMDVEEFFVMLDRVSPRVLADYLCTRMTPGGSNWKKGGEHGTL